MGYTSYKGPVLQGITKAVAKGMFQLAADIVNVAGLKAPVETGQLQQSGKVVPKGVMNVAIQFSRSSKSGYNVAARQEFDESLKHPNGGQAHFVSSTIELLRPKLPEYVKRYKE